MVYERNVRKEQSAKCKQDKSIVNSRIVIKSAGKEGDPMHLCCSLLLRRGTLRWWIGLLCVHT